MREGEKDSPLEEKAKVEKLQRPSYSCKERDIGFRFTRTSGSLLSPSRPTHPQSKNGPKYWTGWVRWLG